jgi:glycine/D-amino acid oxidase-like deaminating enzyme
MTGLDPGQPSRVHTCKGAVIAREVVLATNVALAVEPTIRRHMSIFSSYALMTRPAPGPIEAMDWGAMKASLTCACSFTISARHRMAAF